MKIDDCPSWYTIDDYVRGISWEEVVDYRTFHLFVIRDLRLLSLKLFKDKYKTSERPYYRKKFSYEYPDGIPYKITSALREKIVATLPTGYTDSESWRKFLVFQNVLFIDEYKIKMIIVEPEFVKF